MSKRMDASAWRNYIKVVFVIGFLAGSLALSMYMFSPIIGLVMWSPIFGFIANRWVIIGASRFLAWRKAHVLGPLNGRYYAFDGMPVTVDWNGHSIRVLADDVFRILDFKADDALRRKVAFSWLVLASISMTGLASGAEQSSLANTDIRVILFASTPKEAAMKARAASEAKPIVGKLCHGGNIVSRSSFQWRIHCSFASR
ncbi:MAG: hypothetical protein NTX56_20370 [Proteobacteria bacterium]|nr:hypothetical protein [Pseudomonadota bacterium]